MGIGKRSRKQPRNSEGVGHSVLDSDKDMKTAMDTFHSTSVNRRTQETRMHVIAEGMESHRNINRIGAKTVSSNHRK